jgi:hypothetical protein
VEGPRRGQRCGGETRPPPQSWAATALPSPTNPRGRPSRPALHRRQWRRRRPLKGCDIAPPPPSTRTTATTVVARIPRSSGGDTTHRMTLPPLTTTTAGGTPRHTPDPPRPRGCGTTDRATSEACPSSRTCPRSTPSSAAATPRTDTRRQAGPRRRRHRQDVRTSGPFRWRGLRRIIIPRGRRPTPPVSIPYQPPRLARSWRRASRLQTTTTTRVPQPIPPPPRSASPVVTIDSPLPRRSMPPETALAGLLPPPPAGTWEIPPPAWETHRASATPAIPRPLPSSIRCRWRPRSSRTERSISPSTPASARPISARTGRRWRRSMRISPTAGATTAAGARER